MKTSKSTGDLLVTVEVVVPTKLTERQREAIEALDHVLLESPRPDIERLARTNRTPAAEPAASSTGADGERGD